MAQMLGPDNTFPLGEPLNSADKGGCYAAFKIFKDAGLVTMDFGTVLTWVAVPPGEALRQATFFREAIKKVFGPLTFDASTLPLRVIAGDVCVETRMPASLKILAANPEVFLAWAEKMEIAAMEIMAR